MTTVEILQRMRDNLMERGWCQGEMIDHKTGRVCIVGSEYCDMTFRSVSVNNIQAAYDALYQQIIDTGMMLPRWNDVPGRKFNEVIEILDAAILSMKEESNGTV